MKDDRPFQRRAKIPWDDMNVNRSEWALAALKEFVRATEHITFDAALPDLLADLMHLCDREGWIFTAALETAKQNYRREYQHGHQADNIRLE